jgi:hypothetical protein
MKRETGVDILAERQGVRLIVEAKGFPSTTYERGPMAGQEKRSKPNTQARHWIAEVILTAMLRHDEDPNADIAIALPDSPVYLNLLERLQDSLERLGIIVLIVDSGSCVTVHCGHI